MTSNSKTIIQEIRQEFEMLLEFVNGEAAQQASADQIERGLFKLLLAMGAKLLMLFFVRRCEACCREPHQRADGQSFGYERDTKRNYYSIFGKLPLWRPYFYQAGVGGETPLDAELGLGEDSYSDLLREMSDYLGVYNVYHKTADILFGFLGLKVSTGAIESNLAEDAADVEAYYAQKPAPNPAEEAEILVVQADGKGVPMVLQEPIETPVRLAKGQKRGRKKEAVVTTVYTIAPKSRTPQQVVDSFFERSPTATSRKNHSASPKPQHKQIWATLAGKEAALARLAQQVAAREGPHIQHRVALCDGFEPLQTRLISQFPDFTLILDFIHADEYLWAVANSLLGENDPGREDWMAEQTLQLLSGQTQQVIASFQQMAQAEQYTAKQRTQLEKTAAYFQRNLPYMDYQHYLNRGWPIASGVIEGACRHFVKDRCELSGMRWTPSGVENLLRLRAVAENGDWEAYHLFRKQQRYSRLYTQAYPQQTPLEVQALNDNSLLERQPTVLPKHGVEPSPVPNDQKRYYLLPLAI